jgi:hypothetical protein
MCWLSSGAQREMRIVSRFQVFGNVTQNPKAIAFCCTYASSVLHGDCATWYEHMSGLEHPPTSHLSQQLTTPGKSESDVGVPKNENLRQRCAPLDSFPSTAHRR